jgi:transcription antitermination factor NusG
MGKNKFWFAIKVRERFERSVSGTMESKDIETFLPAYPVPRRWTDRVKVLEVPLFAGYVFCRIDPADRAQVLTIPGVHYFVGAGRVPMPVADSEIESIRTLIQSNATLSCRPYLSQGERVRVDDGPLRGVEGVLLEGGQDDADQLVVSIELLQRSVGVAIDRDSLTPLQPARPATNFVVPRMRVNL